MTASNASTSRNRAGIRRPLGRRGATVVAIAAAATLGLSACSAGQIAQTSSQVPAVTGSVVHSADGSISLNDIQLVLATEQSLKDYNPFHLTFTASNASATVDYPLERITVNGTPVQIEQQPVTLCSNSALTTATSQQLGESDAVAAEGPTATTPAATPAGDKAAGEKAANTAVDHLCVPVGGKSGTAVDAASDPLEDLTSIKLQPITLEGTHRPGTNVDVTFTFRGTEPLTAQVPITVPQHWEGERSEGH
ncbi:hypothetical protein [Tomitella fengzijianii]|uniref:Lipoprotein LpqE n=1 Tax=Tomitella fengzijianii TaxID=2597660 RepID=A0A516X075_9ACTN|nr:hypothetical protein [Tomitella fengzijianii]QDQ96504.1 hypothetical protein FO059_03055 [Tomitella fengzijianii]